MRLHHGEGLYAGFVNYTSKINAKLSAIVTFTKNISIFVSIKYGDTMTHYNDYLAILSPSENVKSKVKSLKALSAKVIGKYESVYSKAHISFQPWARKSPFWIEPLLVKLQRELTLLPPVELEIKGFNYFQSGDNFTIYAELESTPLTKEWFKKLTRCVGAKSSVPHITITRTIPHDAFKKLWPKFKKMEWRERFQVTGLTILKREMICHSRNWEQFTEIPFNKSYDMESIMPVKNQDEGMINKAANTQQLTLF
ncbi:hypothetical protein BH09BAC6_BH09BAC6_28900 [soil metagenome]